MSRPADPGPVLLTAGLGAERADRVMRLRSIPRTPALLVAVCLIGLAVVIRLAWGVPQPGMALLAGANAIVALCGGLWCCAGSLRPSGAIFFFFTFAWLGVAPIFQLATNVAAWGDAYVFVDSGRVYEGLAMNLVATSSFILGSAAARRLGALAAERSASRRGALGDAGRASRGVEPLALHAVALLLVVITPLAIQANGGLGTFFITQDERSDVLSAAGLDLASSGGVQVALVTTLPSALAAAGAVLAVARLQQVVRSVRTVPPLLWIELGVFAAGVVIFANPLSNTRFLSAAAIGAVLMVAFLPRSALAGALFAVLGLLVILVVYPASSVFKTAGSTVSFDPVAAFVGQDFDGFQQVLNSITFVRDLGHTGGIYVLSAVGYFVPRSSWPDKAEPASLDVAAHAGYSFTNLSLPIHAELYIEFGWVGVVVGLGLLGALAQRLDAAWLRRDWPFVPLCGYLSLSMLSIIRGPLGAQVPVYLTVTIIVLLCVRFRSPIRRSTSRVHRMNASGGRRRGQGSPARSGRTGPPLVP